MAMHMRTPQRIRLSLALQAPFSRCASKHFVIFCWLVVAIIRDPGVGTLKGALPYVPAGLSYLPLLDVLGRLGWGRGCPLRPVPPSPRSVAGAARAP